MINSIHIEARDPDGHLEFAQAIRAVAEQFGYSGAGSVTVNGKNIDVRVPALLSPDEELRAHQRSLGYDISDGAAGPNRTEFQQRVLGILDEASTVYADRNAVYKDNFRIVGKVMEALFPGGRPGLKKARDYDRWHIFELLIVKLTRYASNFDDPHEDSLLDQLPYLGILGALDQELREGIAAVERASVDGRNI